MFHLLLIRSMTTTQRSSLTKRCLIRVFDQERLVWSGLRVPRYPRELWSNGLRHFHGTPTEVCHPQVWPLFIGSPRRRPKRVPHPRGGFRNREAGLVRIHHRLQKEEIKRIRLFSMEFKNERLILIYTSFCFLVMHFEMK